jgi:hypothetical protein
MQRDRRPGYGISPMDTRLPREEDSMGRAEMTFAVIWSTGHQVCANWQRALAVQRAMQRARPGDDVRVELAEAHAAEAVAEGISRRQRGQRRAA